MYNVIKNIEGTFKSEVKLIEVQGKMYVYKKAKTNEIIAEKFFHKQLSKHNIRTLKVYSSEDLFGKINNNEIILEYINGSPTLDDIVEPDIVEPDIFAQLGNKLAKVHSISSANLLYLNDNGLFQKLTHKDFIDNQIKYGKQRAYNRKSDLTDNQISKIEKICSDLSQHTPDKISLIHGDLHPNNVLIKNKELVFFDVSSIITFGDPYRDLSLLAISFPNNSYITTNNPDFFHDRTILESISRSYSNDFINHRHELLDRYVLLRAFTRYPNPFELYLKNIITSLIRKYE